MSLHESFKFVKVKRLVRLLRIDIVQWSTDVKIESKVEKTS